MTGIRRPLADLLSLKILIPSGKPCKHPGCISHKTHVCEGCGRDGAEGDVLENPFTKRIR